MTKQNTKNNSEQLIKDLSFDNKLSINRPIIFVKKQKKDLKIIPFKVKPTNTAKPRHYTPAAQEWRNSIYAYNLNYYKLLPAADKTLMNLVTSYFNFYRQKIKTKIKPEIRKGKLQKINIRKRSVAKGISANKIFIGKGHLKHTSSNILITLFIYNIEQHYLMRSYRAEHKALFYPNNRLTFFDRVDKNDNIIRTYNRTFTFMEYQTVPNHRLYYKLWLVDGLSKLLAVENAKFDLTFKSIESKVLSMDEQLLIFNNQLSGIFNVEFPKYGEYWAEVIRFKKSKLHSLADLIKLNQIKFYSPFLYKLKKMVSYLYQKNVEFNIVNLKKMHLNSDIFTQAVTLKLKNRENKLYRVLKKSLVKVNLPNVSKKHLNYRKGKKEQVLINNLRNMKINTLFANYADITKKDYLSKILSIFYPKTDNLKRKKSFRGSIVKYPVSLTNFVIRSLKHIKMLGIRVEAKGRLTRRFTASRSVFKMRYKGGLKNIDSSFKGLPDVMLRGHVRSNVEYTMLNSKNRNGAFGVKGWVSSK